MDIGLWMSRDLLTVTPETPLCVAGRCMAEHRVRHLLVVAAGEPGRLVGIVSSHDLYLAAEGGIHPFSPRAADRDSALVSEVMTAHPIAIRSNTSIATAARLLLEKKFGCLPVVDRGELVGILTEHDILRALMRMSGADQHGYEVCCLSAAGDDDVLGSMSRLAARRSLRLTSASVFDHEGQRYVVVHFAGGRDDEFVESLWRSGHRILRAQATDLDAGADAVGQTVRSG